MSHDAVCLTYGQTQVNETTRSQQSRVVIVVMAAARDRGGCTTPEPQTN